MLGFCRLVFICTDEATQIATCPGCREEVTSDHLFTCKSSIITDTYKEHEEDIREYVESNFPAAAQSRSILTILQAVREDHMTTIIGQTDDTEVRGQAELGQQAFVAGLWNKQWIRSLPSEMMGDTDK